MSIDASVLSVTVNLDTALVTPTGFGTPLIAGAATGSWRTKRYAPGDAYATDSDLTADIIAGITRIFAQSPRVDEVVVGKVDADVAQVYTLTINAVGGAGEVFGVTINGTDFTYTTLGGDAPADVSLALFTAVNAGAEPVTAADLTGAISLTSDVAGEDDTIVVYASATGNQTMVNTTPNVSIKTSLDLIVADDADWYGLITESRTKIQIQRAVEWVTLNGPRLYIAQSSDADIITSAATDVMTWAKTNNYDHVAIVYDATDGNKIDAGWPGKTLQANPDRASTTWAFKTLTGITAVEKTTTAKANILSKNGNFYDLLKSNGAMWNGKVAKGFWIDEVIAADWLAVRIGERVAAQLLAYSNRNEKIPYTDAGFAVFEGEVQGLFNQGVQAGHFVANTGQVVMPSLETDADVPVLAADRTARRLVFEASIQLAGAIHIVNVTVGLTI